MEAALELLLLLEIKEDSLVLVHRVDKAILVQLAATHNVSIEAISIFPFSKNICTYMSCKAARAWH